MTGPDEFVDEFATVFEDHLRPAVAGPGDENGAEVGDENGAEVGDENGAEVGADDRAGDARARRLVLRVFFLLFVQANGWLDGNPTYVQDRYDAVATSPDRDVGKDLFAPLFDALGTPGRTDHEDLGTVPYLGGPFVSHPDEDPVRPDAAERSDAAGEDPVRPDAAERSEAAFHALLDPTLDENGQPRGLCRRYEFDLAGRGGNDGEGPGTETGESDDGSDLAPSTGTVTPATVARAFELAMGPAERSEMGAFYTPPQLTRYVARTALARYLAGSTGATDDQATALLTEHRPPDDPDLARECAAELRDVTVLDPAAGGGAFVVAVIEAIAAAMEALRGRIAPDRPAGPFALRRDVLADSVHAVDLDPAGVDVARFRAWLYLLRAAPPGLEAFLSAEYALPNLDRSVFVANSLVGDHDPTRSTDALDAEVTTLRDRLADRRREYARARGDRRATLGSEIDRLTDALDEMLGDVDPQMADIAAAVPDEPTVEWSRRLPGVVLDGGFDVVLGNPPYEGRSKHDYVGDLVSLYADRHDFYETVPGMRSNLYQQFVVRGWELARDGGVLSFVTSDTFLTIRSKRATRNLLLSEGLTDLVRLDSAFDATVDTAVFTLRTGEDPGWFNFLTDANTTDLTCFARLPAGPAGAGGEAGEAMDGGDAVEIVGEDGTVLGHRVRAALFRESLDRGFFRPTPRNLAIHERYLGRATELAEEWGEALRNSRANERYREAVERDHLADLEPGDVTLLGLLVTGGVGIQVPTNDSALAYLAGTDPAGRVRDRNDEFRYVEPNEEGYYHMSRVITPAQVADPAALTPHERENGITGGEYDPVWVPIEKGTTGTRMAFYHPPIEYVNWSRTAVQRYRDNPQAYLRNSRLYFSEGIFAAGQGSGDPEFRYTNDRVVDHSGNILVPITDLVSVAYLLGVLCSSLSAYLVREFVNHTVNTQLADFRRLPVKLPTAAERDRVEHLVERAIATRKGGGGVDVEPIQRRLDETVGTIYDIDPEMVESGPAG